MIQTVGILEFVDNINRVKNQVNRIRVDIVLEYICLEIDELKPKGVPIRCCNFVMF